MLVEFHLMNENAKMPSQGTQDSAGWDIYASEDVSLVPGKATLVKTGLQSAIPVGFFAKLFDRSGNALKRNFTVSAGVIDADYRGEWGVVLTNHQPFVEIVKRGERIAQAIFFAITPIELKQSYIELSPTERVGGFGSTGR